MNSVVIHWHLDGSTLELRIEKAAHLVMAAEGLSRPAAKRLLASLPPAGLHFRHFSVRAQ